MKKNIIKICVIIGLLAAFKTEAVGIFARPAGLNLEVNRGDSIEAEFLVGNIFEEPAAYQIYSDNYKDQIKFSPSEFQLYPGENQIVKVTLIGDKFGKKDTNISIVASPLGDSGLIAKSGVKIPLSFQVAGFWRLIMLWGLVLPACFAAFFVVKLIMLRAKNQKPIL